VKENKAVRCQGLEEPLATAGSWVPTKTRGAVGQDWVWVSALTVLHQGRPHTDPQCQGLILSSALLPRQGSQQVRDPFAGWKVLM